MGRGEALVVRTARADDWEDLRDLRIRALETDVWAFSGDIESARSRTDREWQESASRRVLAYRGDVAVGSFGWSHDPVEPELVGAWVAPESRGLGVGLAMTAHAVACAAARRMPTVRVEVYDTNTAAVALYRRAGFAFDSRGSALHGPTLVMRRATPICVTRERAGALLYADGHVALIERVREGVRYVVVPGGGIEDGEDVGAAVRREVLEETGLVVGAGTPLAIVHHLELQGTIQHQHYTGFDVGRAPLHLTGPELESGRGSYVPVWVPVEDAAEVMLPRCLAAALLSRHRTGTWPSFAELSDRTPQDVVSALRAARTQPQIEDIEL